MPHDLFDDFNQLTASLGTLDDRGLVLSLAAFAEEALGDLLKSFMIPSEATKQLVEGFNAPLGTFSSRIKAAYAMGLLTKDQFQDLERLRKIRNEFAHSWKALDLAQTKIGGLIDSMSYSRLDSHFPKTSSAKIRSSISCLLIELSTLTSHMKTNNTHAKLIGRHLIPGFPGDFRQQVQEARDELTDITAHIEKSDGKERDFYLFLLASFAQRLSVIARPAGPKEKEELATFLVEFEKAILLFNNKSL